MHASWLVVSLLLAAAPSETDLAQFKNLGPQMSVARLALEGATIEAATKALGTVPRKDWLKVDGKPFPYLCWVGPDGTRLGMQFVRDGDRLVLGRFEIVARGVPLVHRPSWVNETKGAPTCKRIGKAPRGSDGGLRLGMTRAEAIALLGEQNRNIEFLGHEVEHLGQEDVAGSEKRLEYGGWIRATLAPAERASAVRHGLDPDDFFTGRELRLEFDQGRLVAIRALQMTAT